MKKCTRCKDKKEVSEFNKDCTRGDGLANKCRDCTKALTADWYRRNREAHSAQVQENSAVRRKVNRQYVYDYLKAHPCVECGETDPLLLDFDHCQGVKNGHMADLVRHKPLEAVKEEIDLCQVLCVVCHRRKTARERGWYADLAR